MELTEIEELIEKERLYLLETDGFVAMPKLVARAAYAIHERMQEGVVWQKELVANVRVREGLEYDYVEIYAGDLRITELMHKGLKDGQLVQVTVRRIPCNESTSLDSGEER